MSRLFLKSTLIMVVSAAFFTAVPAAHAATLPDPDRRAVTQITVQAGDTLSGLATLYGFDWAVVAAYNHLSDPNLIDAGLVLELPPPGYRPPVLVQPTTGPVRPTASPRSAAASYGSGGWSQPWACIAEGVRGGARYGNGESGGNPADTPNGPYYGGLQFAMSTWLNNGGVGNPAYASIAEQEAVASRVLARGGWSQWPQTSRACGF